MEGWKDGWCGKKKEEEEEELTTKTY